MQQFPQFTTSSFSGAAISNKSAPNLFAAETIYFLIKGIAALTRVGARAPKSLPRFLACPRKTGKSAVFSAKFSHEV